MPEDLMDGIEDQSGLLVAEPEEESTEEPKEPESEETPEETPEETQEDEKKHKSGWQKRVDKLTAEKYQLQAEKQRLQAQLQAGQTAKEETEKEPDASEFKNVAEYIDAVTEFKAKKVISETLAKTQTEQAERAKMDAYNAKVNAFKATHADYDMVVGSANIPIPDGAVKAILASDKSAELTYMLAKNPEMAYRLGTYSDPIKQAVAIGQLEAKLSQTRQKKTTDAPPPPNANSRGVGGGSTLITKDVSKMTPDEYSRWKWEQRKKG